MFNFYGQLAGALILLVAVLVIGFFSAIGYIVASRWVERRNNMGHVLGAIFGILVLVAMCGFAESIAWGISGCLLALFYLSFALRLQRGD